MGLGAKNDKITVSSLNDAYSHQDLHDTHCVSSSSNSPVAAFAFEESQPILQKEVSVSMQVVCVDECVYLLPGQEYPTSAQCMTRLEIL